MKLLWIFLFLLALWFLMDLKNKASGVHRDNEEKPKGWWFPVNGLSEF